VVGPPTGAEFCRSICGPGFGVRPAEKSLFRIYRDTRFSNDKRPYKDHIAAWWTHNPSFNNPFDHNTMGANVSIPLRIFDRNQGEKARTQIDIGRNERLQDATQALVFSDVDSAYWTLIQALNLLKPYKAKYLPLAEDNRNRITISFQNGGASLLDFLDAEKAYRDTRLAYLNLIGSYLTAGAQMNMAAGREVLQ